MTFDSTHIWVEKVRNHAKGEKKLAFNYVND